MSLFEDIGGCPEVDGVFGDVARCDEGSGLARCAVASADDAVGEVAGVAAWFYIDEFGGEVCVDGGCGCVQGYRYGTCYFGVLLHWGC